MVQTEQPLSKLSKDDLAKLVLDYQGKFDSLLKTVKNEICELKTKFTELELELHVSRTFTHNLTKYNKILEQKFYENEQYLRREYLEISGIPGSIADNALGETVFNLFQNVKTLSTLQMMKIVIDSNRLIMSLRKLLGNSQNGKMYIES